MTKEEKLQFKFKYDKMLDDVFFTKEFKQYMIENCKFCPSGLTIDTNIDDDKPQFCVCTKEYGYDYSGERVPGDFYNLNYKINENLIEHIMRYLHMKNENLFNEILKYIL